MTRYIEILPNNKVIDVVRACEAISHGQWHISHVREAKHTHPKHHYTRVSTRSLTARQEELLSQRFNLSKYVLISNGRYLYEVGLNRSRSHIFAFDLDLDVKQPVHTLYSDFTKVQNKKNCVRFRGHKVYTAFNACHSSWTVPVDIEVHTFTDSYMHKSGARLCPIWIPKNTHIVVTGITNLFKQGANISVFAVTLYSESSVEIGKTLIPVEYFQYFELVDAICAPYEWAIIAEIDNGTCYTLNSRLSYHHLRQVFDAGEYIVSARSRYIDLRDARIKLSKEYIDCNYDTHILESEDVTEEHLINILTRS